MQMLILQFVSTEDGLDLGGGGGLAAKSHHPQRRGHHHRGDEDVLCVLLLRHVVVEAKSEAQKRWFTCVMLQQNQTSLYTIISQNHRNVSMSDLKARLALVSASVVAWLLSFLSSAEAMRPSRQRATMLVIHILSVY